MRTRMILPATLLLGAIPFAAEAHDATTVTAVVDKIVTQEQAEVQMLRRYSPLVETYIQTVRPDKEHGAIPDGDRYFLGRAELANGVQLEPLINDSGKRKLLLSVGRFFSSDFLPRGFLQMIYLDADGFDRQHYKFTYAGKEFLGEVRCVIFDVDPLPGSGKGRFAGRIWVEDQDYHIVRFNGAYTGSSSSSFYFNFDSWRSDSGKNEWLPAFIYSEEGNVQYGKRKHSAFQAFKAQTRLWGYDLNQQHPEQTLTSVQVEGPQIKDQAEIGKGYSPLHARRAWEHLAEENVAAKMQRMGLMAPYGDVDKMLETVVNNLEVTNELDIQPEVRCRVLMTSTLESFTIGHTIVLSRGLIDVLPDEASLAAILAHELGHVTLGHRMDTQFAFFSHLRFDDKETFHHFGFARKAQEEEAANKKGAELLKKSPYRDQSGSAQAFFQALQERAKEIPNLISPHLGDSIPNSATTASAEISRQPATKSAANTLAALPIGGRIIVQPWDDRLVMRKPENEGAIAEYEKMPFEVAPFLIYLTRPGANSSTGDSGVVAVRSEIDADQPLPLSKP
ncbi:MAG TPA: M48 family metalloprotease [Candidatus Acidoferrum sp.]|nr:M48 family metalloprotease [Candidatus Acidoferrum sp.]